MITAAQIRAARALLGIEPGELAARVGITRERLLEMEAASAPISETADSVALQTAFRDLGVLLFSAGDCPPGGEGVRLARASSSDDGLRPEELNATNDD